VSIENQLDRIETVLTAHTKALAELAAGVADIAGGGGLTGADLAALVQRLKTHALALEGIARNVVSPPPKETSMAGPKAIDPALAQVLTEIDTATNAVAATVTSLDALINTGMTPADVSTVKTTLAGVAARLTAIAADPLVPVPVTPPTPPPVPAP
jgi:hypothetical protein